MRAWRFDAALKVSQQALKLYEVGVSGWRPRGKTLPWLVMALILGSPHSDPTLALVTVAEACP